MTIQELMEKRAKLWDEAKNFLDTKRSDDSSTLSEDDEKTYAAMENRITALDREIDRLTRLEGLKQKMNAATTQPVVTMPGTHVTAPEKASTATDEYKAAFWNNIRNRNWIDVRNDLQVGTDSEGGYLVPDEFVRL